MPNRRAPQPLALVQDLVNTYDVEDERETLVDGPSLTAFLTAHGLGEPGPATADLPAVRELREALRGACLAHAGHDPDPTAVQRLNRLLADAPLVVRTAPDGRARLVPAPGTAGAGRLTSRIAADIAAAAAEGTWQRLKACEAEDCRWVFYDRSPAGRSRWCSMQVCGSRAKMRAYRDRRRTTGHGTTL
ncbi:CGNR zinc finger domain-containing protein [Streptomyces sp. TR06-5]|uniref:CGNR zinc finger domain-containing protein n=1 Tax=unclassified Streptomyces TaxID=2593676 RepID=UPI0039A2073C